MAMFSNLSMKPLTGDVPRKIILGKQCSILNATEYRDLKYPFQ